MFHPAFRAEDKVSFRLPLHPHLLRLLVMSNLSPDSIWTVSDPGTEKGIVAVYYDENITMEIADHALCVVGKPPH